MGMLLRSEGARRRWTYLHWMALGAALAAAAVGLGRAPAFRSAKPPPFWAGPWRTAPTKAGEPGKRLALFLDAPTGLGELVEIGEAAAQGVRVEVTETAEGRALLAIRGESGQWLLEATAPDLLTFYRLRDLENRQRYRLGRMAVADGERMAVYPHDLTKHERVGAFVRDEGGGR
jgi:hypothetical protein